MKSFKGQALNYTIIVEEEQMENINTSGIDISSEADKNEKYRKGVIVSFGNLCPKNDKGEETIKIGQTVLYDNYKASDLIINGENYKTFYYADLVAFLE